MWIVNESRECMHTYMLSTSTLHTTPKAIKHSFCSYQDLLMNIKGEEIKKRNKKIHTNASTKHTYIKEPTRGAPAHYRSKCVMFFSCYFDGITVNVAIMNLAIFGCFTRFHIKISWLFTTALVFTFHTVETRRMTMAVSVYCISKVYVHALFILGRFST